MFNICSKREKKRNLTYSRSKIVFFWTRFDINDTSLAQKQPIIMNIMILLNDIEENLIPVFGFIALLWDFTSLDSLGCRKRADVWSFKPEAKGESKDDQVWMCVMDLLAILGLTFTIH